MYALPLTMLKEVGAAESHYIGDINPNVYVGDAGAYITGFTHSAWRVIAQYYISWYKSGTVPAITVRQRSSLPIRDADSLN